MENVVLRARDLDGFLTDEDRRAVRGMSGIYERALGLSRGLARSPAASRGGRRVERLIAVYNEIGSAMRGITERHPNIHVYPFETPDTTHGEASRLIAKLRDSRTEQAEFVYYVQRAYELLFNFAFVGRGDGRKNHIVVRTPVNVPEPNFAVHKIPDVDRRAADSVMCVLLRGALLPSMILSKEIEEFTSNNYLTPFALFRISRDDRKTEQAMEYHLRLDRSYFDLEALSGKDLFFADPMNATGGSLITIAKYLASRGVRPKSIKTFNVVSALKGAIRIVRALEGAEVYTLWMDPALNRKAYILPGLGDAGDRMNGPDGGDHPRDIVRLIADYGAQINALYRSQVREIEGTVLASLRADALRACAPRTGALRAGHPGP